MGASVHSVSIFEHGILWLAGSCRGLAGGGVYIYAYVMPVKQSSLITLFRRAVSVPISLSAEMSLVRCVESCFTLNHRLKVQSASLFKIHR